MRVLRTASLAFPLLAAATTALAECPGPEDLQRGYVLLTSDELPVHVRATGEHSVWIAYSKGGRPPSATGGQHMIRTDAGFLPVETTSHWNTWHTNTDLNTLLNLEAKQSVEVESKVVEGRTGATKRGVVTFRLMREREVTLGDCTYAAVDFAGRREIFNDDGTSQKLPGYFTYIPDLKVALTGMWDGGVHNVKYIRKAKAGDWFPG